MAVQYAMLNSRNIIGNTQRNTRSVLENLSGLLEPRKDNLDTWLNYPKNADFMLHQDCLENAFCIYHFRYIPCVALFLRVTGFPFLGTRSLHSADNSDLAMKAPLLCCLLPLRTFFNLSFSKITVYSRSAPKTKIIQAITQHSMAVSPSAFKKDEY